VSDHLFEVLLPGMFIILTIINNQHNRLFQNRRVNNVVLSFCSTEVISK